MNFQELEETLTPPKDSMQQTYINVQILDAVYYPDGKDGPSIGVKARGSDGVVRSHWLFRHSLSGFIPKTYSVEMAGKCMAKFADALKQRQTPFKMLAYDSQLQVPKTVPEVGTLSEGRPSAELPFLGLPTPNSRMMK